ncbi:hypothetical protein [Mycobacterium neglectum]|uniref:hypothetical protein n=1 Tax=Mycobacterium neglectum TaxID=242737 RepID=UPI000BFEC0C5|nr:hypothetical protein [Mycobacterium neglectum]
MDRDLLVDTQEFTPTWDTGELDAQPDPVDGPEENPSGPLPLPARSVVLPGEYQYVKRWHFVVVVACVWALAAAAGWGLYHWWYHSIDKTAPEFVVLVFLILCTVGGLLVAMVPNRPIASVVAIAFTSAPLAATAGAAVLHGLYFCEWATRCFVGLIPY